VTTIGDYAFFGCKKLESVYFPDAVTYIGASAFAQTNLKSVNISAKVNLGMSSFYGCNNLKSINVDFNNPHLTSIDGVLFNKDASKLIQYPAGKKEYHYSIPQSVNTLSYRSFSMSSITDITIPENVTLIEQYAFYDCDNLVSVTYQGLFDPVKQDINASFLSDSVRFICVPREYANTTFCRESIIGYSSNCDELKKSENQCYEASIINNEWVVHKKYEISILENETNDCVVHFCYNDTGHNATNKCHTSNGSKCMNGTCVKEDEVFDKDGYVLTFDIENEEYQTPEDVSETICDIAKIDCNLITVIVEYNNDGTISQVIAFVEDKTIADVISETVPNNPFSLFRNSKVHIKVKKLELSGMNMMNNLLYPILTMLFIIINAVH